MKRIIFFCTYILIFYSSFAVAQEEYNHDDFPARWLKIEIDLSIDDAKQILGSNYASVSIIRTDGSGYREFWKAPNSLNGDITEDFVFRTIIPHGDVYVIFYDSEQRITSKEVLYITEEEYQKQVRKHREAKREK